MNVAIWLLSAVLALPIAEILVFVTVAAYVGFAWTLLAVLATSFAGALMLRHGGAHVARMRVVLGPQRMTALEADSAGTLYLLAAILLLVPGFISDLLGLILLIPPLRRLFGAGLRRAAAAQAARTKRAQGVVDLDPEDWRRMPDRQLRDDRQRDP